MVAITTSFVLALLQQEEEPEVVGLAETLPTFWFYVGFLFLLMLFMYLWWRWWHDWGRFFRPGKIGTSDPSMGGVDLNQTGTAQITGGGRVGRLNLNDIECGATYFVTCSAQHISNPDCKDGLPYFAVIEEARQCAEQRALQVAARCEALGTDCHAGDPSQQYVEWGCRKRVPVTVTLPDGQQVQANASTKYAIVMYRVTCSREF